MLVTTLKENDAPRARAMGVLRGWIESGKLPRGAILPTERDLSNQLGVKRTALRWALAALEEEGLIATRGSRTRQVASVAWEASDGKGVMAHSIAVLAPSFTQAEVTGKRQPGWAHSFVLGAHAQISDESYNLLSIHPARLKDIDLKRVIDGRPLGIICPEISGCDEATHQKWVRSLVRAGIPIVAYGNSPDVQVYDRVASDHEAGSYELTRWLLARGCRRIAMFFSVTFDVYWAQGRRNGYERAMREAGLEPLPTIHHPAYPFSREPTRGGFEEGYRHLVGHLIEHVARQGERDAVDALLLESDGEAFRTAAACRLLGRTPGADLLLAGYDDYALESWERDFEPIGPQVTINKRNDEIGREMVRLLIDRSGGRLPSEPQLRLVIPELIVL